MAKPHPEEIKANVLIVTDVPSDFHSLSNILTKPGYTVHQASDGQTALTRAATNPPDLMLVALHLADMNGYTVCQRLQVIDPSIPVLLINAQQGTPTTDKGFAAGCADYISKPFQSAEILARVQTHLRMQALQKELAAQSAHLEHEHSQHQETARTLQAIKDEMEQRIAERSAALRASDATFRYLLARARDGYVIINAQQHISYANARAKLYLGLSKDDVFPPIKFKELIARQYHCEPTVAWDIWPKRIFVGDTPVPFYLVRPETPTNNALWLQVNVLDVLAGIDEEAGRIIRIQDVTESTTLQDALNKFHSMVSHKLRTPLVPMYSGLQYLAQYVLSMPREDMAAFIQDALTGMQRLSSQIEDIVQYLNTPSILQPSEAFSIARFKAIVAGISAELGLPTVNVHGVNQFNDTRIMLSQQSMELILWEILENAKKFHPKQDPIVEIQVSRTESHQVSIQFRDNGLTLSPEQLVQMWMPYYQADKYTTGQIMGMGLGLSLVATQIWGVGGTCQAVNRENSPGIVIELVLPLYNNQVERDRA